MKQGVALFLEIVVSIVISVILTTILPLIIKDITIAEQIVVGLTLMIAIAIFRNNYSLRQNTDSVKQVASQQPVWNELKTDVRQLLSIQHKLEDLLPKIREVSDGIKVIANKYSGEDDLFEPWYDDKLDNLLIHIRHTIELESFFFDISLLQEHDRIFKIFKGRDSDFFYATATCEGISWFATPSGDLFVRAIDDRYKAKVIPVIKRLFIYDDKTELNNFATRLCFLLHQQSGYEYKVISKKHFESVIVGFDERTLVWDFGIYGTHFVWETPPEDKIIIRYGEVCVKRHRVELYTKLFNKLWGSAETIKIADDELIKKYSDYKVDDFMRIMQSVQEV